MKKYKVTDKHAILKEGLILNETSYEYRCKWGHIITNTEIKDWVKCGWIEEIQEKEFTKDDMIEFAQDSAKTSNTSPFYEHEPNNTITFSYSEYLDKWTKRPKK